MPAIVNTNYARCHCLSLCAHGFSLCVCVWVNRLSMRSTNGRNAHTWMHFAFCWPWAIEFRMSTAQHRHRNDAFVWIGFWSLIGGQARVTSLTGECICASRPLPLLLLLLTVPSKPHQTKLKWSCAFVHPNAITQACKYQCRTSGIQSRFQLALAAAAPVHCSHKRHRLRYIHTEANTTKIVHRRVSLSWL